MRSDFLAIDYEFQGKKYRVGQGLQDGGEPEPVPFPHPALMGEKGIAVIKEICRRWGTRPKTLIHGDGHPGNLFMKKEGKALTWIDFQACGQGVQR